MLHPADKMGSTHTHTHTHTHTTHACMYMYMLVSIYSIQYLHTCVYTRRSVWVCKDLLQHTYLCVYVQAGICIYTPACICAGHVRGIVEHWDKEIDVQSLVCLCLCLWLWLWLCL